MENIIKTALRKSQHCDLSYTLQQKDGRYYLHINSPCDQFPYFVISFVGENKDQVIVSAYESLEQRSFNNRNLQTFLIAMEIEREIAKSRNLLIRVLRRLGVDI